MSLHLIHRQILHLCYRNVAQAKADLNSWGERFEKIIQPAMEEVLNDLDLPNQTIRIELLELDLGKIPSNLDPDLLRMRVKSALRDQILKEIPNLNQETQKVNQLEVARFEGNQDQVQDLELLLFLLEYGRNPWWKSTLKAEGIRSLVQKLLQEKNKPFRSILEKKSLSNLQLERLLNHLDSQKLEQLANWVFPVHGQIWRQFIFSLEAVLPQVLTSKSLWEVAKSSLLVDYFFTPKSQKSHFLSQWMEEFLQPKAAKKIPAQKVEIPLLWALKSRSKERLSEEILKQALKNWIQSPFIEAHSEFKALIKSKDWSNWIETFPKRFQKADSSKETIPSKIFRKEAISKKRGINLEETYPIQNAGLVLCAPFLPYFFKGLGLVENKEFVTPEAQNRAALLIQTLMDRKESFEESDLLLNKILCGINPYDVIPVEIKLTESEQEEIPNLLQAMVSQWTALKSTSGESMAKGFFPREGILKKVDRGYELQIPRISIDILLNRLPWTISIIKLPWMQETLFVEW